MKQSWIFKAIFWWNGFRFNSVRHTEKHYVLFGENVVP
jgi:hypothetical protein